MNNSPKPLSVFLVGMAIGGLLGGALFGGLVWRSSSRQMKSLMSVRLNDSLITATKLGRGDETAVMNDILSRLPGMISSVKSFGVDEGTRPVLAKAREFYERTEQEPPAELKAALR